MMKPDLSPSVKAKEAAGKAAADFVQDGMLVGLGSGSTSAFFIEALGKKCKEGLQITAVPTSRKSKELAESLGIPLMDPDTLLAIDLTVDGADEIDPSFNIIKGGGGALLREKIIAQCSQEWIVIIDESKLVHQIGSFPVAIEICPFAFRSTVYRLEQLGYRGNLRLEGINTPFRSDNGNFIFDIIFTPPIVNLKKEEEQIKQVAGVLETGLFYKMADRCIIGKSDGTVNIMVPI